jgi:EAL domain-containing protein (putative c-di-GMP-specific phosphodiesterase class I)
MISRAIEQEEFVVYYQPQVDFLTSSVVGMEALVRWEHPERGLLIPAEFIAVAEETSLIVPLGQWVLEESCRQASNWRADHPSTSPLTMSVNLSLNQLQYPDLVEKVAQPLQETELEPSCLTLEITESVAMNDPALTVAMFQELKRLGVQLAIDDFGTGHSSLR